MSIFLTGCLDLYDKDELGNRINYNELVQLKNNLISGMLQYDNLDPNKNDLTDETGSFTK